MVRVKIVVIPVLVLVCLLLGMLPVPNVKAASLNSLSAPVTSDVNELVSPYSNDLPYEFNNTLTISQAPKFGETAELTFTVDVIKLDNSHPEEGLARSRAWIDFYWTNTKGSFSEAYGSVQIPLAAIPPPGRLALYVRLRPVWCAGYPKDGVSGKVPQCAEPGIQTQPLPPLTCPFEIVIEDRQ